MQFFCPIPSCCTVPGRSGSIAIPALFLLLLTLENYRLKSIKTKIIKITIITIIMVYLYCSTNAGLHNVCHAEQCI